MKRLVSLLAVVVLALVGLYTFFGHAPATPGWDDTPYGKVVDKARDAVDGTQKQSESLEKPGQNGRVDATLDALAVSDETAPAAYDRDAFGPAWADIDRNGCDTRNDILGRDLDAEAFKAGTNDCVVLTGTLNDPYTGSTIDFVRGQSTSQAVQIDHIVSLSDAWHSGAWQWDEATRERFANDPANLAAVDGPANQSKGDSAADEWLPPNEAHHCAYVRSQVEVKASYSLTVTSAEKAAMSRVLEGCSR